jgi:hypothetical protein
VFFLFTLGIGALVGVRAGVDEVADEVFDDEEVDLTPEQAAALRKMLDKYGGGK